MFSNLSAISMYVHFWFHHACNQKDLGTGIYSRHGSVPRPPPPPPPPPSPFHLQYMVTYLSWQNSLVIFYNKTGLDTRTMSMSLQSCLYKFGMISDDTVWYVLTLWWVSCVLLTSAGGVWVHLFLSTVKKLIQLCIPLCLSEHMKLSGEWRHLKSTSSPATRQLTGMQPNTFSTFWKVRNSMWGCLLNLCWCLHGRTVWGCTPNDTSGVDERVQHLWRTWVLRMV